MAIFEPVTLEWKGKPYVIQPDQLLRAIALVEDILPLGALHRSMSGGALPLAKLAMAFGALLRFAGAKVEDDEAYSELFKGKGLNLQRVAFDHIRVLQVLMIPPEHLRAKDSEKKAGGGGRAASSLKPTSSRSGKAG